MLTFLLFHDLQSVGALGLKGFTGLKLCATTLNNMQQHAIGQGCALIFPGGPQHLKLLLLSDQKILLSS